MFWTRAASLPPKVNSSMVLPFSTLKTHFLVLVFIPLGACSLIQESRSQRAILCLDAVRAQIGQEWSLPDRSHETPSIRGDFNGDGLSDGACLGAGEPGTIDEWRLFVVLGKQDEPGRVIPLPEFSASTPVDWIRIFREPAGEFTTFCGLAPGECDADALHKLELPHDSIYLVVLEASSVLIYWDGDNGQFKRQWMSD